MTIPNGPATSWKRENGFDAESLTILEIAATFLVKYFDHRAERVDQLITDYFRKYDIPDVQGFLTEQLSWRMAKQIHFTIALGGDRGKIVFWEAEEGLRDTPAEALDYLRNHYWNRDFATVRQLGSES